MPESSVLDFLKTFPFGLLISAESSDIRATHIPLEIKETKETFSILGHIAAANPHCEFLSKDVEHLTVFNGPHSYVSASWYKNINVSTWNYQAIHVYGKIRILTDSELVEVLTAMLEKYETGRENAVTMNSVPEKMQTAYLKEIVGFEFFPTRIEAKSKLSQNRSKHDFQSVVSNLEKEEDGMAKEVAAEMRKLKK